MGANLHFHGTLHHNVELLARMGGELDSHVLLCLRIGHGDEKRLCCLVFEQGGHVQIFESVAPGDGQAVVLAHDGVGGKGGADALDQVGGVDAEALRAFVDKGKAEIRFARLAFLIFLFGDAGAFCHFILRKARDFPHGADAFRDLC